jgi:hypothetical protein
MHVHIPRVIGDPLLSRLPSIGLREMTLQTLNAEQVISSSDSIGQELDSRHTELIRGLSEGLQRISGQYQLNLCLSKWGYITHRFCIFSNLHLVQWTPCLKGRLQKNIVHYFVNRLTVIIFRRFDKSMYILILVKSYNIYIYDMVIVVSIRVDNILLKMIFLTETCKGWRIKNTTFIYHTGQWLKILYTSRCSI